MWMCKCNVIISPLNLVSKIQGRYNPIANKYHCVLILAYGYFNIIALSQIKYSLTNNSNKIFNIISRSQILSDETIDTNRET